MTKRFSALALLLAALTFGLVACGGDDQEPVAQIDELAGVETEVTFDKGFVEALGQLQLTPGVVGDAKLTKNGGAAAFPISGGNVTYYDPSESLRPYVQGTINHDGAGLSLTGGGTTVELTDFEIDPGTSELTGNVTANGETAAEGALLFKLDGSTLKPLKMKGGNAVLKGTTVLLSKDAADLLNKTFKVDALAEDFVIGESKITVAGK